MDWVFELTCSGPASRMADTIGWANRAAGAWASLPELATLDLYGRSPTARMIHSTMTARARCSSPCWRFPRAKRSSTRSAARNSLQPRRAPGRTRLDRLELRAAFLSRRRRGGARAADRAVLLCGALPQAGRGRSGFHQELRRHPSADAWEAARHPRRDVLFPASHRGEGVQPADYIIGNEVVFDHVAAFNAAMQSPVRQELRRHFREFPPFSGLNTHFPMNRRRLVG